MMNAKKNNFTSSLSLYCVDQKLVIGKKAKGKSQFFSTLADQPILIIYEECGLFFNILFFRIDLYFSMWNEPDIMHKGYYFYASYTLRATEGSLNANVLCCRRVLELEQFFFVFALFAHYLIDLN